MSKWAYNLMAVCYAGVCAVVSGYVIERIISYHKRQKKAEELADKIIDQSKEAKEND